MTSRDELHDLMSEAANTPLGKTHNDLWAKAAELAEAGGFEEEAVISYVHLVNGYATGGQGTQVIAPFIWCDQKIKERPDLFSGEIGFSHAWHYKYVIGAVRSVPSVPVQQCEDLLEEMRKHYLQLGDGLRAYYIRKYLYARDWGTEEEAVEAFNQWRTSDDSELSDCSSCDPGYEVAFYGREGNWQKAVEIGEAALARQDENSCDSQPEALLTEMMEPWSRVGNDASAWSAHTRAYRRYQEGARYLEDLPPHLHFLYLSGTAGRPQRLERGLRILLRHLPWWPEADAPTVLLNLAIEGALLFSTLLDEPQQRLSLTLPGEELVWYPCETLVNPTAQEAYDWMRALALGIATQFDNRPGLRFKRNVAAVERRLQPQLLEIQADEVAVPDVSGLYTEDKSEYAVVTNADLLAQGAKTETNNDSELPQLAPIVLDTSWQSLSISQLFQAVVAGFGTFSSYYTYLYHRLFNPQAQLPAVEELTVFAADTEEAQTIAEFWQTIVDNRYTPWNFPGEFCAIPDAGTAEATVIPYLAKASQAIKKQQFAQAIEAAQAAMQIPGLADALGIRLYGLDTLGYAYASLGETDKAIQAYRQTLNLYASLGVTSQQALAGWKLAIVLSSARRTDEALEVLQTSADVAENLLPAEHEARLREQLADLYEQVELLHSALRELLKAYALVTNADQKLAIAEKIVSLASEEGEFQTATDFQFKVMAARKAKLQEPLTKETKRAYEDYVVAVFGAAHRLVGRPGIISEADKLQAKELLETCFQTLTALSYLEGSDVEADLADFTIEAHRTIEECYSLEEAERRLRQALAVVKEKGNVRTIATGLLSLGALLHRANRLNDAKELLEELLALEGAQELYKGGYREYARHLLKLIEEAEKTAD